MNIFEKTFFNRIQNKNNSDVTKMRQRPCSHSLQDFQYSFAGAVKASKLKQNKTTEWAASPVTIPWGKRGKAKWCHSLGVLAKMQTKDCSACLVFCLKHRNEANRKQKVPAGYGCSPTVAALVSLLEQLMQSYLFCPLAFINEINGDPVAGAYTACTANKIKWHLCRWRLFS